MNAFFPHYHPTRRLALAALVAGAATFGTALQAASLKAPEAPADYAAERASSRGTFVVAWRSDPMPVPVGQLHNWTLHVATADGAPVTDAAIQLDGDMPAHGHGLPTRPRVTRHLGNGDYLVEGVKFQMGGWWVMDFEIAAGGRTDTVRFNLQLKR